MTSQLSARGILILLIVMNLKKKYKVIQKYCHFFSDDRSFGPRFMKFGTQDPKKSESEIKNYDFWKWLFKNGKFKFLKSEKNGASEKKRWYQQFLR